MQKRKNLGDEARKEVGQKRGDDDAVRDEAAPALGDDHGVRETGEDDFYRGVGGSGAREGGVGMGEGVLETVVGNSGRGAVVLRN